MKPIISSSMQFDDPRYYSFARSSGLPLGYFGKRRNVAAIATGIGIALAVVAIVLLCI